MYQAFGCRGATPAGPARRGPNHGYISKYIYIYIYIYIYTYITHIHINTHIIDINIYNMRDINIYIYI